MSAQTEAFEKAKQLRADMASLDKEIIRQQEKLELLNRAYHALQSELQHLTRELR